MFGTPAAGGPPQTWIFKANQWTHVQPQSNPSGRVDAAIGFDYPTKTVLLYGRRRLMRDMMQLAFQMQRVTQVSLEAKATLANSMATLGLGMVRGGLEI